MKLKKLTIKNFRCYKDLQEIEFDQDGKITLIYGLSGHGKSTLLHFIKWMFYDIYPGKKNYTLSSSSNTDPLYNIVFFEELESGKKFSVFGSIEFEHNGISYELIKETFFEKSLFIASETNKDIRLNYMQENGSWVEYTGNVYEKINEIVPKALSKYFFFSGEENVIEEANNELKDAIYNLFGLTKYQNALNHLGNKQTAYTVINKYEKEKTNNKPKDIKETASKYLEELTKFDTALGTWTRNYNTYCSRIKIIDEEISDLTSSLAILKNGPDYQRRLNEINSLIKYNEKIIASKKNEIGNKLYATIPYLILNEQIKFTRSVLADSAKNEKTFKDLSKTTLLDILEQKECVCGRCVDSNVIKHIQMIIDSMPPHSYNYTFNQFVKDVELQTVASGDTYDEINNLLIEISTAKEEKNNYEQEYKDILEKMKKSPDEQIKEISDRLQKAKKQKDDNESQKNSAYHKMSQCQSAVNQLRKKYDDAFKYECIKDEYDNKLEILYKAKDIIEKRLNALKNKTSEELNSSIVDVYNRISTRIESFENKKFLNDDFTLRKEYKTGGQDVVDVFAYIIGMIKAIHNVADVDDGNEFPVVIDAPFSHTDHLQMAHVVNVISEIVPQTTMFTLDIIRIKESCELEKFGKVWFIESDESQKVSWIKKGSL